MSIEQGRILIPPPLRRRARLEREIVFTGLTDRVEIWDRARYEAAIASAQENYGAALAPAAGRDR